ncbi:hypothetical protein ACLOJK_038971 [Asimina triloba]
MSNIFGALPKYQIRCSIIFLKASSRLQQTSDWTIRPDKNHDDDEMNLIHLLQIRPAIQRQGNPSPIIHECRQWVFHIRQIRASISKSKSTKRTRFPHRPASDNGIGLASSPSSMVPATENHLHQRCSRIVGSGSFVHIKSDNPVSRSGKHGE